MSIPPVATGTVALITAGIIERKVRFGDLDATDFSTCMKYGGSKTTYLESTYKTAAFEAWKLIQAVEETRPQT